MPSNQKEIDMHRIVFATSALISMIWSVGAAVINVESGAIHELTEASNVAGNTLVLSGSATLKPSGAVVDGVYTLKASILFSNPGTLSVDVSNLAGCSEVRLLGHLRDRGTGGTVALPVGVNRLVCGSASRGASDAKNYPSFEAAVTFTDENGKVVFMNDATVVRFPEKFEVVAGSRIAAFGKNLFGESDSYSLVDYDVLVGVTNCFKAGSTVTVGQGRRLQLRLATLTCTPENGSLATWSGVSDCPIPFGVMLNGSMATLDFASNQSTILRGDVTGTGNVVFSDLGKAKLIGSFNVNGSSTVSAFGTGVVTAYDYEVSNGAQIATDFVSERKWGVQWNFKPDGAGVAPTAVSVASVSATSKDAPSVVFAQSQETITIGTASGWIMADGAGSGAKVVVRSLASNATLEVTPDVAVQIDAYDMGARIVLKEKGEMSAWSVAGPSEGAALSLPLEIPAAARKLSLGGNLRFSEILSVPTLVILPDATVAAKVADGCVLDNRGGVFHAIGRGWREMATLWADATMADTFTMARAGAVSDYGWSSTDSRLSYFNAAQIMEWRDCRPDRQSYRIRATKFDPTGKDLGAGGNGYYVFPSRQTKTEKDCAYFPKDNTRARMRLSTGIGRNATLKVKCAVLVFNGAMGGGNAILGAPNGELNRLSELKSDSNLKITDPLVCANTADFTFRKNGATIVDCTTTGLDADWQILTFTCPNGIDIAALGTGSNLDSGSTNGGQIYGEVLLFEDQPEANEILNVEKYLSDKWGIVIAHSGADVTKECSFFGAGSMALADDLRVTNGCFSGTVALNGHRFELAAKKLPFTAADIPSEGRVLWMDPSYAGTIEFGNDEARPDEVAYLNVRSNNGIVSTEGLYLTSPYSGSADRRVRAVTSSRNDGPILPWLVFSNAYSGDSAGNHLIFRTLPKAPMSDYTESGTEVGVKAGFLAVDTSKSGGTVLAHRANGSGDFACRAAADDPIFPVGCAAQVKEADAWLDSVAVDPSEATYSRRPEVLSFNLKNDATAAKAKLLGYFMNENNEIIGETLLYGVTLNETVRERISAYLMWKWLGQLHPGYSDFRGMTVSGVGTVVTADADHLPAFAADFTGTVELTQAVWPFVIRKGGVVANPVDLSGRTVALPAAVTVDLDLSALRGGGTYRLMSAGILSPSTQFSLGTVIGGKSREVKLEVRDNALYCTIVPTGIVLIVR